MTEPQAPPAATQTGGSMPEASSSPFAPPQISLPKGGGAIRGIGEKFSANPVTGTGSLSVPIALTAGRSGFTPQLALSYDSGTGNGPFGVGWSLSLPAITRKTDKGLPQYRDSENSDIFILSGAEDLVPVLRQGECGGWIAEETERDGYQIRLYRPRVEGLFARIERWTRLSDCDVHWRSISKDNIVTFYGLNAESRIFDPENATHIFSWLICQSFDTTGNGILYEYVPESDHGVDLCRANERNRERRANRYLKRVKYGNRRPLLPDPETKSFRRPQATREEVESARWMFEVVFDYGDSHYSEALADERRRVFAEADLIGKENLLGSVRRDPFSTYRSTFEVRTYRLCNRILVFHHFPKELGVEDYLVRSTAVEYEQKELGAFLRKVTQSGYKREEDGRYLKKSLPSLELQYLSSPLEDSRSVEFRLQEVAGESLDNLPSGIDGSNYRWLDLDGEGISGVLSEQANSWFYKPNLGNGRFAAVETISPKPSLTGLNSGIVQLMDIAGDGNLDLVELGQPSPGFYERTVDESWRGFRTFRDLPVRNWKDPNLRFVDLTGDGIADVLVTEDEVIWWHPSQLTEGFGEAKCVFVPQDEEHGPRVVFADAAQSIYLADMSGDGMSDIVRIRNGEVCYWPNLGYGRFGAKVTMDNAPWFDEPDLFNQRRIHLADTDGSGTTDIVYFAAEAARIFLNQCGNSWSDARELRGFPATSDMVAVSVVDILGKGTACLVWSSTLPGDAQRPLHFVDLMCGRKPHLLHRTANNLGAETILEYASSTEFYLADKAAGHPWLTRLPFPVHVVRRSETIDRVSHNRFVTSYTYHHGYFDGVEREFRGFGRVEQLDAEQFTALEGTGQASPWVNESPASQLPPTLTKTWFHTGVYIDGRGISRHLEDEYYLEGHSEFGESPLSHKQRAAMLLEDTILPPHLTPEEAREACRSLKGSMLRQETYALDRTRESCRPYTVSERNFTVQPLQPRGINLHAVFFTHARESISLNYERKLYDVEGERRADPRVTQSVVLRVDDYGNVLESVSLGYGRRFTDPSSLLGSADHAKQRQILITLTENRYTNAVLESDAYRTPAISTSSTYELTKIEPRSEAGSITNLFRFDELAENVRRAKQPGHEIPFEGMGGEGEIAEGPLRRLIKRSRNFFRSNDLSRILTLGELESLALAGQNFNLAFTPGLIDKVYRRRREGGTDELLLPNATSVLSEDGRYFDLDGDGHWWIPSGRFFFSPQGEHAPGKELAYAVRHFFLAHRFLDPFGNSFSAKFDRDDLALVQTQDALNNIVSAEIDYRVLAPHRATNPNGNRAEAAFDTLGYLVGTVVMGKERENVGDSLEGFVADLDELTIREHLKNPLHDAHRILQKATTRIIYDLFSYVRSQESNQPEPTVVYTLARETHVSDLKINEKSKIQHSFSYSDGFGREIQKKFQAEPDRTKERGTPEPRWVGDAWTIFNNKGLPVRQYEPFFSSTQEFEFAVITGVSSILLYDSIGRVVATLHPNHTFEKIIFDPWKQETWDVNDNILIEDPATDVAVGPFFQALPKTDYLPTWYQKRAKGGMGAEESYAATNAAVHANTPAIAYFDSLGRVFMTVGYNRFKGDDSLVEERPITREEIDIQGNEVSITDALGNRVVRVEYDMASRAARQESSDAGERWVLYDALNGSLRSWNSRRLDFRYAHDALRRLTGAFLRDGKSSEKLVEQLVYGEGLPEARDRNIRGQLYRQFDQAGIATNRNYDFKGNLLSTSRQLLRDYGDQVDWSTRPGLEKAVFTSTTSYDALNRIVSTMAPDGTVLRARYNEASLLQQLQGNLAGKHARLNFLENIDYNAKGQRLRVELGNGALTDYAYDPETFRLIHLKTSRHREKTRLQDLHYHYDPVGNVALIQDESQQAVYFDNQVVSSTNSYVYDALYRLVSATGREHSGHLPEVNPFDDRFQNRQPLPNDGRAMRRYRESFLYDSVGNMRRMSHSAQHGSWTRHFNYHESGQPSGNNRLKSSRIGDLVESYSYDFHGNTTSMPHVPQMDWDFKDQLHRIRQQIAHDAIGDATFYVYDPSGQRVRKVTERIAGRKKKERIYLGGFEIYREYNHENSIKLQRTTLHVMDDKQRVALVETKTIDTRETEKDALNPLIRYQFGNHLDSAVLELDESAAIISYEEYYPYGSTSFQAVPRETEVSSKRYRFAGKERDDETGFYYFGARYYASWLGRWTSTDPGGMVDGPNVYAYARENPVTLTDPFGMDSEEPDAGESGDAGAPLQQPTPDYVNESGEAVFLLTEEEKQKQHADLQEGGAGDPVDASNGLQPTIGGENVQKYIRQEVETGEKAALRGNPIIVTGVVIAAVAVSPVSPKTGQAIADSIAGPEPTSEVAQGAELYTSVALQVGEALIFAGADAAIASFRPRLRVPELGLSESATPPRSVGAAAADDPALSGSGANYKDVQSTLKSVRRHTERLVSEKVVSNDATVRARTADVQAALGDRTDAGEAMHDLNREFLRPIETNEFRVNRRLDTPNSATTDYRIPDYRLTDPNYDVGPERVVGVWDLKARSLNEYSKALTPQFRDIRGATGGGLRSPVPLYYRLPRAK